MEVQKINARPAAGWAAAVVAAAALAACGTPAIANAASPAQASGSSQTLSYYAFDLGSGPDGTFRQGTQLIINDQLTTTKQVNGGYPIVGHDAGTCTVSRLPARAADSALADCAITAQVSGGSIALQGIVAFKSQQPQPAVLAVTGGTGRFTAATGTADVSFTKDYRVVTIRLA